MGPSLDVSVTSLLDKQNSCCQKERHHISELNVHAGAIVTRGYLTTFGGGYRLSLSQLVTLHTSQVEGVKGACATRPRVFFWNSC